MDRTAVVAIPPDGIHRRLADRHDPFASPLAKEPNASVFQIDRISIQRDDLAHSSARSIQGLAERVCPLCICARKVASALWRCKFPKQPLYITKAQHSRETAASPREIDLCADGTPQRSFAFRKPVEHPQRCGSTTSRRDRNVGIGKPGLCGLCIASPGVARTERRGKRPIVTSICIQGAW
jgi:hypothetical protein